jgi:hypothetical protein
MGTADIADRSGPHGPKARSYEAEITVIMVETPKRLLTFV